MESFVCWHILECVLMDLFKEFEVLRGCTIIVDSIAENSDLLYEISIAHGCAQDTWTSFRRANVSLVFHMLEHSFWSFPAILFDDFCSLNRNCTNHKRKHPLRSFISTYGWDQMILDSFRSISSNATGIHMCIVFIYADSLFLPQMPPYQKWAEHLRFFFLVLFIPK